MTVIAVVDYVFESVHKGLKMRMRKLDIGGKIDTILINAQWKSARILRIVLET